ncbi:hypothetical protein F5879DRAFT_1025592 [Lentinula edodes]|nr:hypothetical protein F5879DRAFT_1025592 [Lentinula edodes]
MCSDGFESPFSNKVLPEDFESSPPNSLQLCVLTAKSCSEDGDWITDITLGTRVYGLAVPILRRVREIQNGEALTTTISLAPSSGHRTLIYFDMVVVRNRMAFIDKCGKQDIIQRFHILHVPDSFYDVRSKKTNKPHNDITTPRSRMRPDIGVRDAWKELVTTTEGAKSSYNYIRFAPPEATTFRAGLLPELMNSGRRREVTFCPVNLSRVITVSIDWYLVKNLLALLDSIILPLNFLERQLPTCAHGSERRILRAGTRIDTPIIIGDMRVRSNLCLPVFYLVSASGRTQQLVHSPVIGLRRWLSHRRRYHLMLSSEAGAIACFVGRD